MVTQVVESLRSQRADGEATERLTSAGSPYHLATEMRRRWTVVPQRWTTHGLSNRSCHCRGNVVTAKDTTGDGEGGEIRQFTCLCCLSVLGHCLPIGQVYPEAWGEKSLENISYGTKAEQEKGEKVLCRRPRGTSL